MPKYINLDDYCKDDCKCNADSCDKEKCPLWAAPTADVVEVVRCKDCKYSEKWRTVCYCKIWRIVHDMGEDGFCGYAERKEENE